MSATYRPGQLNLHHRSPLFLSHSLAYVRRRLSSSHDAIIGSKFCHQLPLKKKRVDSLCTFTELPEVIQHQDSGSKCEKPEDWDDEEDGE
ncbi:hypothetical protein L2E82_05860 [Cichorium intybus]|uniref:Uncharacterized protein n=1 Tax=Cichorium intybus TaxID=13427 RepID=A0ACB9H8F0_CICIN|nr:hypothetical protein L2E82_05860 [Cichorium intybus]